MRIFLLDDEQNSRETIKAYLAKSRIITPEIVEAHNVNSGLKALKEFHPDLAILDINLGDGTSFDLLSRLDDIKFKIIFISAYDEYAIKAFKFNALDYILKPVNPLEFNAAIEKTLNEAHTPDKEQLQNFHETISSQDFNKIVLRDSQAIHFIDIHDIIHCQSENNYTVFSTIEEKITISKTLAEYEEILRGKGFFRSHRSHLINLRQVKKFDKREGGSIEMSNGERIPLARNKKELFMKLIDKLG